MPVESKGRPDEPISAPLSGAADDFPVTRVFMTASAWRKQLVVSGFAIAILSVLTGLSYFSGDQHNTIFYLFGPVALYIFYRLAMRLRHMARKVPEVLIDAEGLRLYHPSSYFWSWPRMKGARVVAGAVIVDLHPTVGIDQGEVDRVKVTIPTKHLGRAGPEIEQAIAEGVRRFGQPS